MAKRAPKQTSEDTVKVRALSWYSNGDLETNWAAGEVREIPAWKLKRLENDLPGNWKVIDG